MSRTLLLAALCCGLAGPVLATEWLYCADAGDEAEIGLLLGTLDVLAPAGVTLRTPDRAWTTSTAYGDGGAITVGQAFGDSEKLWLDLLDGDFNARVGELRLFRAEEGETIILGGTLRVVGVGAWAVSCAGF